MMYYTAKCLEKKRTQHIISYQLSSTAVEGWWFGLVLQPQDMDTLNSSVYQDILASTVRPCVWQLKVGQKDWVMQNAQQQIYNRMAEKEKSWGVAMVQSPDLNLIEILLQDVDACPLKNLKEVSQHCREEWTTIPLQPCERAIRSYIKQVTVAKCASIRYLFLVFHTLLLHFGVVSVTWL